MVAEYKRAELTKNGHARRPGRRPARAAPLAARCGPAYRCTVLTRLVSGHGLPTRRHVCTRGTVRQWRAAHPFPPVAARHRSTAVGSLFASTACASAWLDDAARVAQGD